MQKGFTLAETLITLGIIGIVSALTMPVLIADYRKNVTVTRLKKAYSTVNQAILLSVSENGEYSDWDDPKIIGEKNYFNKYWLPYIKDAVICDKKKCDYYGRGGMESGFTNLDGSAGEIDAIYSGRSTLLLPDGTVIIYFLHTDNSYNNRRRWIYIDTNGVDKPNTYGKDVFVFLRDENGAIIPNCKGKTRDYIDADCSLSGSGSCCAEKIIMDGWKINY